MKLRLSLFILLLSACAMANNSLSIWIMPNGASPKKALEQELKTFTKETDIKVNVSVLEWDNAFFKLEASLKSNPPSIVQLGSTWIPYFASRGYLLKLDPYMNDFKPDRFLPVSFGTTHIENDPAIYALPWFIDVRILMGNKRILNEIGIKKSDLETYEEFVLALKRIQNSKMILADSTPIEAYACPGKNDWNIAHNFAPWIWSEGGAFVHNENGQVRSALLEPYTLKGIAKYLKLVKDSLVTQKSLSKNTAQIAQAFNNGQVAFILNTAEIAAKLGIEENAGGLKNAPIGRDGLEFFPVPKGSAGSIGFIGGSNLSIPALAKDKDNALKLLMFLTSDSVISAYTKHIGFLPATEESLAKRASDSIYIPLLESVKSSRAYPSLTQLSELENILTTMFSNILQLVASEHYSDEKLFEILAKNDLALNTLLGNGILSSSMTFEQFQKIWVPVYYARIDVNVESKAIEEASQEDKNETPLPYTFALLALAVFAGFIFTYRQKR